MTMPLLWKWRWRELWQGSLWSMVMALILVVASVFALSSLVLRVEALVLDQSRRMLTADTVLSSSLPLDSQLWSVAKTQNVLTAQQTRFNSMMFSQEGMQLVTVKAVDSQFPLRGELTLRTPFEDVRQVNLNQLWLADELFSLLSVVEGDSVTLGDADFTITGRIVSDPEWSFNPFNQQPQVFIHHQDLEKTGAVQFGSRIKHIAYFMGDASQLSLLKDRFVTLPEHRWQDENSPKRTGDWLRQIRQYLSLTLVMIVVLSILTFVVAMHHYVQSRKPIVVMMKKMGATQSFIFSWLFGQLVLLMVCALLFGWLVGWGFEFVLRLPLQSLLPEGLPALGVGPFLNSASVAIGIALPSVGLSLLHLVSLSPMAQSRQILGQSWLWFVLLCVPLVSLIMVLGKAAPLLGFILAMIGFFLIATGGGLAVLFALSRYIQTLSARLAIRRMQRTPWLLGLQLAALSVSLTLIAILVLLRDELILNWQQTLPQNAPNVFALNIAPSELSDYVAKLDREKLVRSDAYPILRGRLVAKNGDVLDSGLDPSLRRELNFTWQSSLSDPTSLVAGEWGKQGEVSIEKGLAKRLNIKLGDQLSFSAGGEALIATVGSIRSVEWRSMKPNFYFIFHPQDMKDYPFTGLISFQLPMNDVVFLNALSRQYPTVSVLDLRSLAERVGYVLDKMVQSLAVLTSVAVLGGILLISTVLRLSMAQRETELSLYRVLGATRRQLTRTLWWEFGLLGLLAGLFAAFGTQAVLSLVLMNGFDLEPHWYGWLWLLLPLCSVGLVVAVVWRYVRILLPNVGNRTAI